jgi:hypothetical protein
VSSGNDMGEDGALYTDRRRAGSFGDDAERYDRVRPPYPPELIDACCETRPVDPRRGAVEAAAVLRPEGRVGLFWNQAQPDPSVRPALEAAYGRYAPALGRQSVLMGLRDVSVYQSIAHALVQTGLFDDVHLETFGDDARHRHDDLLGQSRLGFFGEA